MVIGGEIGEVHQVRGVENSGICHYAQSTIHSTGTSDCIKISRQEEIQESEDDGDGLEPYGVRGEGRERWLIGQR